MKNIHVLPTNKSSRLANKDSNNKLELSEKNTFFVNGFGFTPQNIYITSDEEIKDNDYCIDDIEEVFKIDNLEYFKKFCKKIILTDNTDLIKDGVQAIDDEFLEWFVKNPSCEEVEVKKVEHLSNRLYRVIIPKEEILPEQIWNDEKMEGIKKVIQQHKQETLKEDAAKRYPNNGSFTIMDIDYSSDLQLAYIEGFNAHTNNLNIVLEELKLLKEELSYEKRKNIK